MALVFGRPFITMHSGQPPGANLIASGQRPISPANHLNSATQLKNCPSENEPIYTHWFPPGYRFIPEDDELILHYLNNRIMNKPMPYSIIRDVELYKHNPKDLAENYSDNGINSWYFFTPRDRKYKNGSRPNRAAGDGYWKATGADKLIYYNNEVVGAKKALVFHKGKPPKGTKTSWIMQEYRVHQPPRVKLSEDDMRLDDWVLCRIYKKEEKSIPNKRQRINEDHVTELRQNDNELTQTKTNLEGMVCKENDFQEGNVLMNRFGNSLPSSHFDNTFADDHVLINSNYNFDCYDLASASFPCENSAFRSKYLQQEMASMEFEEDVLGISRDNFDLADDFGPYVDSFSGWDNVLIDNSFNHLIDPLPANFTGENSMSNNVEVPLQCSLQGSSTEDPLQGSSTEDDLEVPLHGSLQCSSTEDYSDDEFSKILTDEFRNH
ncbi:NAC transcription factor 29-like [Olea europaea subsp. europaea]|uniref:NAC transcription factor 29-like n=1 Tax=Olea europaea subsp. europaea TaxID=158383 RepID=A0A8S0V4L4_OLEEU|nr:NAC transcription factor 29-like [Olea europaea subsp. europaea]